MASRSVNAITGGAAGSSVRRLCIQSPATSSLVKGPSAAHNTLPTNVLSSPAARPCCTQIARPHTTTQHISPASSQTRRMSSMPATNGHNKACCNIPPVVHYNYVPKGTYTELGGYKTYVTGPEEAEKGIVSIFDIFGFFKQTLQGADILATSNQSQKHKIFMPDWFKGDPVPIEWFPPDTEEKQKKLGEWFGSHGPQDVAAALPEYVKALQKANPSIKSWGILGYCWGGKVVELATSAPTNPFSIAAVAHPAMIDPTGAEKITIPYIMLASGEDPETDVKAFEKKLKVPHHVEIFKDQVHGWMAARGDLSDPHVREEYARGYKTVLQFLGKQWS